MDDAMAKARRDALDAELAKVPNNVGVLFGTELLDAFARQKWLTTETFDLFGLGTGLFATKVIAYDRTHAVLPSLEVGKTEFKVGSP